MRIYRERLICDESIRLFGMEEHARADARIRAFENRERRRLAAIVANDLPFSASPDLSDEDGREFERRLFGSDSEYTRVIPKKTQTKENLWRPKKK